MSKKKVITIGVVIALAAASAVILLERNSRATNLPEDINWGDSYSTVMEKLEEAKPSGGIVEDVEENYLEKERVICVSEFKFMGYPSELVYHVNENGALYKIDVNLIEEKLDHNYHPVIFHKKMERSLGPGEDVSGDRDDFYYNWEKDDTVIHLFYPYDSDFVDVEMWEKDAYYDEHPDERG